ncbi:MAG: LptF/LptG family permease [Phycisphaerae bacterium]|nr:LptF/LptG family permease [Phycisphaerae bacterium]
MKILQWYIARELIKTFVLTAFGLTLAFSLCGGVLNMLQVEVLTAVQIMKILTLILPVATTFTLPVAALFACAVVYGRFAADNEFDACKASGINIHRLFAPAVVLSLFTAVFTFVFSNYVIPSFIHQLDVMVRADLPGMIQQALDSRGYFKPPGGGGIVHARKTSSWEDPENKDTKALILQDAAFLMLDNGKLIRCGTAEQVVVECLPNQAGGSPMVKGSMEKVVTLDLSNNRLYQQVSQPFEPTQLPKFFADQTTKWLNLNDLYYYLRHPLEYGKIRDGMANLREGVRLQLFYRDIEAELTGPNKRLVLKDSQNQYEIRAEKVLHDPEDYELTLENVVVVAKGPNDNQRTYGAPRCRLKVKRGLPGMPENVVVSLDRAKFTDSSQPDQTIESQKVTLEVATSPEWFKSEKEFTDADLLGISPYAYQQLRYASWANKIKEMPSLGLGSKLDKPRKKLLGDTINVGLQLTSTLHSRFAFSACSLVMLVLAAGLAIIFRGGQILTAFIISFIPGLAVVIINISGRQLAEKPPTYLIGLVVIWSGIVLLAIADAIVLKRYLRR